MVARSSEAGRAASGPGIAIVVIAGAGFAALALLVAAAVVRVRAGEINPAHAHWTCHISHHR